MCLRKTLAIVMMSEALAMAAVAGDTPDLPDSQPPLSRPSASAPSVRSTVAQPEPQSFLDGQSEMERRKLLDKQQRTFQLEIDGKYAKALKAYCDTGYGDERCSRPEVSHPLLPVLPAPPTVALSSEASPGSSPPPHTKEPHPAAELPTVSQISGVGDELSAVLVFASGRRLKVVGPGANGPGSRLPNGESVISIRPGEVLVGRLGEGKPTPLLFQSSPASLGSD